MLTQGFKGLVLGEEGGKIIPWHHKFPSQTLPGCCLAPSSQVPTLHRDAQLQRKGGRVRGVGGGAEKEGGTCRSLRDAPSQRCAQVETDREEETAAHPAFNPSQSGAIHVT